jgi:ubiquitin-protein ligase E3 C
MFADELTGNTAKKRADEAKARRLRAKREKEAKDQRKRNELDRQKQGATAAAAVTGGEYSVGGVAVIDNAGAAAGTSPSSSISRVDGVGFSEVASTETTPAQEATTAAQKAAEQRKLRAEARARVSAAITIQSLVRCKQVAAKARDDQRVIFDKRMSDLMTLSSILKQEYVPPPATVSAMTSQFIYFAFPTVIRKHLPTGEIKLNVGSMVIEGRDQSRLMKLVKKLLLPGLSSDDLDLDPILPWVESFGGKRRLEKVLALCVTSISTKHIDAKPNPNPTKRSTCTFEDSTDISYRTVDSLLRTILRLNASKEICSSGKYTGGARDEIYKMSCSMLMQPTNNGSTQLSGMAFVCDLISSLRSLLLFGPTRTNLPIPGNAGRLRESCVTNDEKDRASILLQLTVDLIASMEVFGTDQMSLNRLSSRFISEVMSVPLLTWKVLPASYEGLIHYDSIEGARKVPQLVNYIHRFINMHADAVSDGRVESVLNLSDVSLATCPAPAVLCLLANLIQIGKTCDAINGVNRAVFHYNAAAEYFNFVATLIDSAPQGTFSSRMSAVEWVYAGPTSTPIVLSELVIEQASAFLSDTYVRVLFTRAIDDDELDTKNVLNTKTEKDRKHEKDLEDIGMSSATSVAAKEALADRNRSFWQSSKWAKKLTSLLSGPENHAANKSSDSSKGLVKLMNTSSVSRQLASGKGSATNDLLSSRVAFGGETNNSNAKKPHHEYTILFLLALFRAYGTIISRWGGNGKEDLVRRAARSMDNVKFQKEFASANIEPCVTALLNVLCFSTSVVASCWAVIQSNPRIVSDLYAVIDVNRGAAPIRTLSTRPMYKCLPHSHYGACDGNVGSAALLLFTTCMSHTLIVTDDVEIHEMEKPLPKHQLRRCILLLKKLLYRACCLDDIHEATKIGRGLDSSHFGLALISTSARLQNDLYSRSSRRLLCAPKLWIEDGLLEQDLRRCTTHQEYSSLLSTPVCRLCPFLVSFKRRLKLFERIVTTHRSELQGSNDERNLKPGIMVKVMRGRVLEDGLASLNKLGRDMRQRIVVCYISEAGARETGIDVGGLFKEL